MRGLRRSTQRARNKGKIAQGAAIQMNHFLLNVEMSEWRSSTEQGIRTMQRRFAARSPARPSSLGPMDVSPAHWAGSNEIRGAVPSSSASARSASLGEMRSQSSNADCRGTVTGGSVPDRDRQRACRINTRAPRDKQNSRMPRWQARTSGRPIVSHRSTLCTPSPHGTRTPRRRPDGSLPTSCRRRRE